MPAYRRQYLLVDNKKCRRNSAPEYLGHRRSTYVSRNLEFERHVWSRASTTDLSVLLDNQSESGSSLELDTSNLSRDLSPVTTKDNVSHCSGGSYQSIPVIHFEVYRRSEVEYSHWNIFCSWYIWKVFFISQIMACCLTVMQMSSNYTESRSHNVSGFANYVFLTLMWTLRLALRNDGRGILQVLRLSGLRYVLLSLLHVEANYFVFSSLQRKSYIGNQAAEVIHEFLSWYYLNPSSEHREESLPDISLCTWCRIVQLSNYNAVTTSATLLYYIHRVIRGHTISMIDLVAASLSLILAYACLEVQFQITHVNGFAVTIIGAIGFCVGNAHSNTGEGEICWGDIMRIGSGIFLALSNLAQELIVKSIDSVEYFGMVGLFGSLISGVQTILLEEEMMHENYRYWISVASFSLVQFIFSCLTPVALRDIGTTGLHLTLISSEFYSYFLYWLSEGGRLLYLLSYILIVCGSYLFIIRRTTINTHYFFPVKVVMPKGN